MEWAALIAWVVTAGGGFVLLAIWLGRGGMRQGREPGSRIRPPLILSHFLLAATGLVIWIAYVATDNDTLAWLALVLLAIVAVLGFTMFAIWYQRRQRGPTARTGVTGEPGSSETPPEQHFPVAIVGLHGLLAVTTVVLVFLTAIGVGES
jgi:Ca2+/Na+ antiporter